MPEGHEVPNIIANEDAGKAATCGSTMQRAGGAPCRAPAFLAEQVKSYIARAARIQCIKLSP